MRRNIAVLGIAASLVLAAGSFVMLPNGSNAAGGHDSTFLIPASDGYGVADCLRNDSSECGQVIANAWCEAQGFARAQSFGRAEPEDMTGSIEHASLSSEDERPIAITCAK